MSIAVVNEQLRFTYGGETYAYVGDIVGTTTSPPRAARINGDFIEYVDESQNIRRLPREFDSTVTNGTSGKVALENALITYINKDGDTQFVARDYTPHSDDSHDDFTHSDENHSDDAHDDIDHDNKSHDNTSHDDDAHEDDPAQIFFHQDELHADTHTDHSDLQAPIGHEDTYTDSVHVDQAHEDKDHSDKLHVDVSHDDDSHDDRNHDNKSYSDVPHQDTAPHADKTHEDTQHTDQPFIVQN